MTDNPKPQHGDILISKRSASTTYELSCIPGPPQLVGYAFEAVVAQACQIAVRESVDVWYTVDFTHAVRIGTYRAVREA